MYGQGTNFSTAASNKGGLNANGLYNPNILAVDSAGGLYVVDSNNDVKGNHRVLHYPTGSIAADAVWGQVDFSTFGPNQNGQIDAAGLNFPQGLTLDSGGNLYIVDTANNRVLKYDAPPPPPVVITGITTNPSPAVAGQPFLFTIDGSGFNSTALVNITSPLHPVRGYAPVHKHNSDPWVDHAADAGYLYIQGAERGGGHAVGRFRVERVSHPKQLDRDLGDHD